MLIRLAAMLAAGTIGGCAFPRAAAVLPPESQGYVAVLSGEIPGALSRVARHAWIVANVPGKGLRRFELEHRSEGDAFDYFGHGEVAVHGVILYEQVAVGKVVDCLEREERRYQEEHPNYVPFPGPNSNTIVDYMLRHCDIRVELPATAIGRDYRGIVGASVTSRGTGVQLESWPVGVKLGLEEGAEVHLLGLPFGVHFWPPGITVPVNPGRIGFDNDMHRDPDPNQDRSSHAESKGVRRYGLASIWAWAHYAHVVEPSRARSLLQLGTLGLHARSGYGRFVGYGFGFDLEAGAAGNPLGFAYAARLFPAGALLMLSDNTYVGIFTGIGGNGIAGSVPARFELPSELRFELDLSELVRVGARARVGWYPGSEARHGGSLLSPFADELLLGAFLRVGRVGTCYCRARTGGGYFFAIERGELMHSAWIGASFGVEADYGG